MRNVANVTKNWRVPLRQWGLTYRLITVSNVLCIGSRVLLQFYLEYNAVMERLFRGLFGSNYSCGGGDATSAARISTSVMGLSLVVLYMMIGVGIALYA